jgi:lipopolysaccharide export LptBFGC system permease protein LptF
MAKDLLEERPADRDSHAKAFRRDREERRRLELTLAYSLALMILALFLLTAVAGWALATRSHARIAVMLAGALLIGVLAYGVGCIGLLFCEASEGNWLDDKYPYLDSLTTLPP